jgi:hypothetical protein
MKTSKNYLIGLFVASAALFTVSCDDTEDIIADPNAEYDVVLELNEAGPATGNEEITVNPATETEIKAKVSFTTSTAKDMKRLYITQNIQGAGETIYKPTESVDLKADGSIGLENSLKNAFEFEFDLPVPRVAAEGTVVYKFWATTGNGDFRDVSQRLALGAGTITLKLGTAANPVADVKSYENVKLFAPTADGLSKTFVSLLDGKTYDVKAGSEYAALWDFGYIFRVGTTPTGAGFTSTFDYPTIAVNVPTVSGTPKDDLNKSYFTLSTKTSAQFDAIATSTDLDFVTPTTAQVIGGLAAGSIVQFIDAYGKKGLIRVEQVNGTNGSDGFIIIDIKVQP